MNSNMNLDEKYMKMFGWEENPFNFKIIPNPSSKTIKVKFTPINDKYKIRIYDITGKIKHSVQIRENKSYLEIDISSLNQGVYFIELNNNKEKKKSKIVIR